MTVDSISKTGELLDLGVNAGVVEKSGSWYSYGDERIGQGRENAKIFLSENPDIAYELEDKIRAAHGLDFENPRRFNLQYQSEKSELSDGAVEPAKPEDTELHCPEAPKEEAAKTEQEKKQEQKLAQPATARNKKTEN